MQARSNVASRNLRAITGNYSDPGVNRLDTRRFAGIFSPEILEANFVFDSDTTREGHYDDFADTSGWKLVDKNDKNTSISQVRAAPVTSMDERPPSDYATEYPPTEIDEIFQIPDDLRSMYSIAPSVDPESTMDMMWRPEPKIHMHLADQTELLQARNQAIAMMRDAGLKPTSMIQCRRRGCADILSGVEALKYHLHIHNIADTAKCRDPAPSVAFESALVHGTCNHLRSKSSLETNHQPSVTCFPSRICSVSNVLPLHLSPRDCPPEAQQIPSFTTAAKSLVPDHNNDRSNSTIPGCNNETFYMTSSACRGRRTRKESVVSSVAASSSRTAMFLSPPSSQEIHGRLVFTPHNFLVPSVPGAAGAYEDSTIASAESARKVPERLNGSRSPLRALSPTRAINPIRNGIRRVLSIGCSADSGE